MTDKHVLLLETVSDDADALLRRQVRVSDAGSPFAGGEIARKGPVHAIVTRGKGDVSRELIEQCPDLEVIARCGVGLDNIDVDFATERDIRVVNAPGSNADTVAEHALALMLMLQRQLFQSIAAVKNDNWDFRKTYGGDEIRGKTLGILGMGNIGKKVARLAEAFGIEIVYWDARQQSLPFPSMLLDEVLQRSDILTIHLPLTEKTKHLINRDTLGKMPNHALLINTARGPIIDQEALTEALQQGQIGGFAADVLQTEPPAKEDPLLKMPNVLITPHSASLTARTYNEMCVVTVENTLKLLAGKPVEERYVFNRKELQDGGRRNR